MLGVHFAITAEQERALFAAVGDGDGDGVDELIADLEEEWDDDALKVDTDKAWDPIHRCLTDGTLDGDTGEYPLSHAVLGGDDLHDDLCVIYVSAAEVRDVAVALQEVDEGWLRARFDAIDDPNYRGALDDDDFRYTWSNFEDVRRFYANASAAGRAVIFTAC
ncbi:YfbM family protein [Dactylosporangium sp. AC04546]|uniref:YfbM family protein n=1 Tax=Dactylosporangium sp. AC04546 TaxID=2862460 RepID=UPI001EE0FFA3|nr:YfbM family protein [Dactylosporangium sp. AC04546]WVK79733.1 YfbM family protein [Dactylosporangium sp. AC04546]